VPEITGEWNYTEQFSIGIFEGAVTCSDTGSYQFSQSGDQVDGTKAQVGTCLGSLASSDNTSGAFAISGSLSPTHLRFSDSDCLFEADVLSPSPSTLSGTVSCGDWSGTWQAAPGGAPVATVDVRWDVQTLVGASVKLVAVPRDAAGHALSRSVSWSSDNGSVAQVSGDGLASALAAGSAHITATSEGKSGSATITADLVSFAAVSGGFWYSCALTTTGAAYCWGWGGDGELGTGFRTPARAPLASSAAPLAVTGGHTFATIAAGLGRACGVTTDGEAFCWGDNSSGQLGDGSTTSSLAPVPVGGTQRFARVTVGGHHTCGVTTANAVYCWGQNGVGQLGNGSTERSSSPVLVAGGKGKIKTDQYIDYRNLNDPLVGGARDATTQPKPGTAFFGRPYNNLLVTALKTFGLTQADYTKYPGQDGFGRYDGYGYEGYGHDRYVPAQRRYHYIRPRAYYDSVPHASISVVPFPPFFGFYFGW